MDLRTQLESTLGATYTFERELGGGGMSRVFAAEETRLRRKVVVKVLSPELAVGVSADRFEREIQMAASLQQANIVPVLTVGETGGLPFYTMPFVEGESLRAHLVARQGLAISEVVGIARDVAKALQYAHERGVVHRDIKPDNVLLSGGTAVVTDFGIAKAIAVARGGDRSERDGASDFPTPTLTQIGTSIGTPAYMAPEQAAGDPNVDHRADLYAFGCMVYELLAGHPPFADRTPLRVLAAHMGEPPKPVAELRPDAPLALTELVTRCLEKEPDARPQSAADVLRALDSVTSGGATPAMPGILLGARGMLRKSLVLYALAFIIVAVVARAAIVAIGLPDWVFPGALVVMALGLPVILFTGYVHRVARRTATMTPTLTPGGTLVGSVPAGPIASLVMKASPYVSWRRTWLGGALAVGAFVLLIGAFMLLRALGIGPAASLLAAGKLTARDRLVVTDFRVRGADSALGAVVSEAVRTQLGQSDVVTVLSPAALAGTLGRMDRSPTTPIDLALAREIAQREGAKAVVDGEVTPLGGGYVLTLRLVTADSGAELASYHETADGPKDLLPTLDKLARKLRGKMGESLRTVQGGPPLEQVTTPSLEALKKFAEGERRNDVENDFDGAVAPLEEAVKIDTAFAAAWRKLGIAYANAGMSRERQDSAFARAYRFRDRLTESGRLDVIADYAGGPARDRGLLIRTEEELIRRFPDAAGAYNNLALDLESRREFARAETLFRHDIELDSSTALAPGNLVRALINVGKVAEADSALAALHRRFPNTTQLAGTDATVLYARGQVDSVAAMFSRERASSQAPLRRALAARGLAGLALRRGRVAEAIRLLGEARGEDTQRGAPGSPFEDSVVVSLIDAWFDTQPVRAAQRLDALIARVPFKSVPVDDRDYFEIASVYAMAGRPDRAHAVLAQFDSEVKDTTLRRWFEPDRHRALAEIALAEQRPRDAIEEFRRGDRRPDGPVEGCPICVYVALGRAFDQARMTDSAITMLERFVTAPSWSRAAVGVDGLYLPAVYKRLGELYDEKGDRAKAASYFAKFVELWKDADPELQPKVREARTRLVRLGDAERD
ncbi:MAG TPA: protein kinase [Gemmatimonadaceae bacterium]|jgi:tetratricopeptide (TPR) repeat protein|nr:protein kinase [Gemmatimonadaceae bacterium]